MRQLIISLIVLTAAGCVRQPHLVATASYDPSWFREDWQKVKTKAESTPTYDIVIDCPSPGVGVGVIGKGSVHLPNISESSSSDQDVLARINSLKAELRRIVLSTQWGIGCDSRRVNLLVFVRTLYDIDDAVQIVARWLTANDLDLRVYVTVDQVIPV